MPLYYLDTSALLKRYKTEKGTEVIDELFSSRKLDEVFVTSHFTSIEIESVAARALKGNALNKEACGVLIRLYAEDIEEQIIVLPVSTALLSQAAEAARRNALRAGDAVHLASALRVREPSHPSDLVFVTSDRELLQAAEREGFTALDPENVDATPSLRAVRETAKEPSPHEDQ